MLLTTVNIRLFNKKRGNYNCIILKVKRYAKAILGCDIVV